MFADDTTPVLSHSNFNLLIKDANVSLTAYTTWFRLDKLSLNIKKIQLYHLINSKDLPKIPIEFVEMPQVSNTRFLGIIVGESFSRSEQTDWDSRKINRGLVILSPQTVSLFFITV